MVRGLNTGWTSARIEVADVKNELGPQAELRKLVEVMGKEGTSGLGDYVSCNVSSAKITATLV